MEDFKAGCEDFPAHFVTVSETLHTSRFLFTRLCISIYIILPIPSSSRHLESIMAHSLKNFVRHLFRKPRPRSPRIASCTNLNPLNIDEYQALDEPDRYTPAGLQCRKKASVERLRPYDLQQPPNPPENSASRIRRRLQKDRSERRTGRAPQGGVTATARNAFHVSPAETKRQSPARLSTRGCQSTGGVPAHAGSSNTASRPLRGNARSRAPEAAPISQHYAGEQQGGQRRSTTHRDPLLAERLPQSGRRLTATSDAGPSVSRSGVYSGSAPRVASGSGGRRPAPDLQRASRKPSKQRRSDNGRSRYVEPTGHRAQEQSRFYNDGLSGASTSPTTRHQPISHRIAQLPRLWRGVSFAPSSAATGAEVGDYRLISIDEDERLDVSRSDALRGSGRLTRLYSWSSLVDVQIRAPMTSPQCCSFLWYATNISSLEIGHLVDSNDYRTEWPMEVHALLLRRLTILKTDVPVSPLLMGLSVRKLVRLEVQYASPQPELLLLADEDAYAAFFDEYIDRMEGKVQRKGSVSIASRKTSFSGTTSGHVIRRSIIKVLQTKGRVNWEVSVDA